MGSAAASHKAGVRVNLAAAAKSDLN